MTNPVSIYIFIFYIQRDFLPSSVVLVIVVPLLLLCVFSLFSFVFFSPSLGPLPPPLFRHSNTAHHPDTNHPPHPYRRQHRARLRPAGTSGTSRGEDCIDAVHHAVMGDAYYGGELGNRGVFCLLARSGLTQVGVLWFYLSWVITKLYGILRQLRRRLSSKSCSFL